MILAILKNKNILTFSGSHIYRTYRPNVQARSCNSRLPDVDPVTGGPLRTSDDRGPVLGGRRCRRRTVRQDERRTEHGHRILQRKEG